MAKRRRATSRRRTGNPARRVRRAVMVRRTHRRRRGNPGMLGSPMDWLTNGAGVAVGVIGSRALPQMLAGASNTGAVGYVMNAAAALGLGFLTHLAFPRKPQLVGFVIAGGFAGLISRIAADRTPFGSTLSLSGLGDYGLGLYQKSNFPYPPRVSNGRGPGSSMFTWGDGSQMVSTIATQGADSMAPC